MTDRPNTSDHGQNVARPPATSGNVATPSGTGSSVQEDEQLLAELEEHDTNPGHLQEPAPEGGNGESEPDSWAHLLSGDGQHHDRPNGSQSNWLGQNLADGRYRVEGFLGSGGMGNIYLAVDRNRNDAKVAVKVPFRHLMATPSVRERFQREFQALVELEHPHVCRVIDTGIHDGMPFVVLHFLSGGDLREKYFKSPPNEGPRTVANLFSWLRPIAKALDFVHSRNYVHRDVKPENILFDEEDNPYLTDFGIVRLSNAGEEAQGSDRLTHCESMLGTPGFIAPEVGTGKAPDGRCDLYALAAVTYEHLTGQLPFQGRTCEEIRLAQLTQPVPPAHEINPELSEDASHVLARADLEKSKLLKSGR